MSVVTKDLGMVTAYAYAVSKGYTGTEEEFATLMASYASVAQQAAQSAEAAAGSANAASGSAGTAGAKALVAEGYANGKQNGTAVESGSPYYHDNAEYYKEQAAASAEAAAQSAASLTVDDELSDESTNPVQNKVIKAALDSKAEVDGYYDELTAGQAEQLISNISEEDKVPYNFRTSGGSIDIGDREEVKAIVGGTVAWNQLALRTAISETTSNGIKFSRVANSAIIVNGSLTDSSVNATLSSGFLQLNAIAGHKYLFMGNSDKIKLQLGGSSIWGGNPTFAGSKIFNAATSGNFTSFVTITAGTTDTFSDVSFIHNVFDLTQMFGSTIADYIYSLENANAGAGVAWFRKLFPKDYYAYDAGSLQSVQAKEHITVGFNAYNPTTEKAKVVGGNVYQITGTYTSISLNGETITPDASGYFTPAENGEITVTGGNSTDTCIHLKWDGERDGEYEPYSAHTYSLDDDLVLRGIPKLDSNNKLYYDGDEYAADGTVTRRYEIVDLGTLTWSRTALAGGGYFFYTSISDIKNTTINSATIPDDIMSKFTRNTRNNIGSGVEGISRGGKNVNICVEAYKNYSGTEFKTAMSGIYLVYELETTTTESADPYQNPQIVDDWGTEEFVDAAATAATNARDVAIPVGHVSQYMANLKAKLEMAPDSPEDGNGDYLMRHSNGQNTYVQYVNPVPAAPTSDGNYRLKCTVNGSSVTYSWEAIE